MSGLTSPGFAATQYALSQLALCAARQAHRRRVGRGGGRLGLPAPLHRHGRHRHPAGVPMPYRPAGYDADGEGKGRGVREAAAAVRGRGPVPASSRTSEAQIRDRLASQRCHRRRRPESITATFDQFGAVSVSVSRLAGMRVLGFEHHILLAIPDQLAPSGMTSIRAVRLNPAAIHEIGLRRHGAGLVRAEEERKVGDVLRHELALHALALEQFLSRFPASARDRSGAGS